MTIFDWAQWIVLLSGALFLIGTVLSTKSFGKHEEAVKWMIFGVIGTWISSLLFMFGGAS